MASYPELKSAFVFWRERLTMIWVIWQEQHYKMMLSNFRSMQPEMFCNEGVLRNFLAQVCSCEFCKISNNTFSHRTPPVATSVTFKDYDLTDKDQVNCSKSQWTMQTNCKPSKQKAQNLKWSLRIFFKLQIISTGTLKLWIYSLKQLFQ